MFVIVWWSGYDTAQANFVFLFTFFGDDLVFDCIRITAE